MSNEPDLRSLENSSNDRAMLLVNAAGGVLPGLGPMISTLITGHIPHQRMDRIADFLKHLAGRVSSIEQTLESCTAGSPELDILEDAFMAAGRAFSGEQRERLAKIAAFGLSSARQRHLEAKRLLAIVSELDDEQVLLLMSYSGRFAGDREFHRRHYSIVSPAIAARSQEQHHIRELALQRLASAGLLEQRYKKRVSRRSLSDPSHETIQTVPDGLGISPVGDWLVKRLVELDAADGPSGTF